MTSAMTKSCLLCQPHVICRSITTDVWALEWRAVLDVNLPGQFLCARDAIKQFISQKASPPLPRVSRRRLSIQKIVSRLRLAAETHGKRAKAAPNATNRIWSKRKKPFG